LDNDQAGIGTRDQFKLARVNEPGDLLQVFILTTISVSADPESGGAAMLFRSYSRTLPALKVVDASVYVRPLSVASPCGDPIRRSTPSAIARLRRVTTSPETGLVPNTSS
jgi:hypothetical protein